MRDQNLEAAFVLHTRAYRNTSLLVELLTEHSGRFTVVARGVKRPNSTWKGLLQAFTPLLVQWQGKHELKTLTLAEFQGTLTRLQGMASWCGLYMNELLMRVVHSHDPCPHIFSVYQTSLQQLAIAQPTQFDIVLRQFEKRLLRELGYDLHIHTEAETGADIVMEANYHYVPDHGLRLSSGLALDLARQEQWIFKGEHLLAIAREDFSSQDVLRDAKRLLRLAFLPLLGNKPLQTPRMALK